MLESHLNLGIEAVEAGEAVGQVGTGSCKRWTKDVECGAWLEGLVGLHQFMLFPVDPSQRIPKE